MYSFIQEVIEKINFITRVLVMLEKNAKIFVAGHRGLVGSAIWNNLRQRGYKT